MTYRLVATDANGKERINTRFMDKPGLPVGAEAAAQDIARIIAGTNQDWQVRVNGVLVNPRKAV